jgi:hypothetical protein
MHYAQSEKLRAAPRPTSFNYTREQALQRDMQEDVKSPEEPRAIDMALGSAKDDTTI